MRIVLALIAIIGGGLGIITTLYCVISLFGVIGWKIHRKMKYKISIYD
ncbi:hypothetical protein [Anaerosporobacter sp.]|nr:hypothetical protein [Anaerosporobacter sp.]